MEKVTYDPILDKLIQDLFDIVRKRGKESTNCTSRRDPDPDSKTVGFGGRNDFTYHDAEISYAERKYKVRTTKDVYLSWSPGGDNFGTRYNLKIHQVENQEDREILDACKSGERKTDSFSGGDERFLGTHKEKAEERWRVYKESLLSPTIEGLIKELNK